MITPYPISADPPPLRIRPSLWWLGLAAVLFLGSVGGCAATLTSAVGGVVHTQRFHQSSPATLNAGKYTIYSTGPTVSLVDPRGRTVQLTPYHGNATYTANSVSYEATSTFTARTSGRYELTLNKPGPVAIGHGLSTTAKTGFGFSALGMVGGLTIGIVVLLRRRRYARRHAAR